MEEQVFFWTLPGFLCQSGTNDISSLVNLTATRSLASLAHSQPLLASLAKVVNLILQYMLILSILFPYHVLTNNRNT